MKKSKVFVALSLALFLMTPLTSSAKEISTPDNVISANVSPQASILNCSGWTFVSGTGKHCNTSYGACTFIMKGNVQYKKAVFERYCKKNGKQERETKTDTSGYQPGDCCKG